MPGTGAPRLHSDRGRSGGRGKLVSNMFDELLRAIGDVLGAHGPAVNSAASYTPTDFSIHFFLQIAVILLVCRAVGWAAKKYLGQPQVVGERSEEHTSELQSLMRISYAV